MPCQKKKKSRFTCINIIRRTKPLSVPCLIFVLFCNSISADQDTVASASVGAVIRDFTRVVRLVSGRSGSSLPEEGVLTALCRPQAQRFGHKGQREMPRRGGSSGGDKSAGMKWMKEVNEMALKLQNSRYRGPGIWSIKTGESIWQV